MTGLNILDLTMWFTMSRMTFLLGIAHWPDKNQVKFMNIPKERIYSVEIRGTSYAGGPQSHNSTEPQSHDSYACGMIVDLRGTSYACEMIVDLRGTSYACGMIVDLRGTSYAFGMIVDLRITSYACGI